MSNNPAPHKITASAPTFIFVIGSLKKTFDQTMLQMYPTETIGYRMLNSPCANPITKNTVDNA